MENEVIRIPLAKVVSYLSLEDLCQARLSSRQLYASSKDIFNPSIHIATLYNKFMKALFTRRLSNSVRFC